MPKALFYASAWDIYPENQKCPGERALKAAPGPAVVLNPKAIILFERGVRLIICTRHRFLIGKNSGATYQCDV